MPTPARGQEHPNTPRMVFVDQVQYVVGQLPSGGIRGELSWRESTAWPTVTANPNMFRRPVQAAAVITKLLVHPRVHEHKVARLNVALQIRDRAAVIFEEAFRLRGDQQGCEQEGNATGGNGPVKRRHGGGHLPD